MLTVNHTAPQDPHPVLFPTRHRFHPRAQQDRDHDRREAALRAEVSDLTTRIQILEQEQQTQFRRIAQLQMQLDEALKLVKANARRKT
jgi:hypothetical protein